MASKAVELLYPRRCVGCGRFGTVLCEVCLAGCRRATGPGRCHNCSAEWEAADNCPRCFDMQALDRTNAVFEMEAVARRAVHALKYRFESALASPMAALMAPLRDAAPFDAAVAVPLHRSRQRERGFNQAGLLVRELGWPLLPGQLRRVRSTDRQVGMRSSERRTNIAGAFAYDGPRLDGLAIAVVDDVVTTGATANECALVLREHGARSVIALAFARSSYRPGTGEPIED